MLKLIKYEIGYAIQKSNGKFIDLKNDNFSWKIGAEYFHDCVADKETVFKYLKEKNIKEIQYKGEIYE